MTVPFAHPGLIELLGLASVDAHPASSMAKTLELMESKINRRFANQPFAKVK
jgi:hypothetical protein